MRRTFLLALLGSLLAVSVHAATPYLVKDINQQLAPVGSYPEHYLSLGSVAVFTTTDGNGHALELWRTDGTAAGTFKLSGAPDEMVVWNTKLWFTAGGTLWSSDGTVAGTQKLTLPVTTPALAPSFLMAGPAYLYFFDNGMLWRTNGTTAGTTRVSTVVMTPGRSATEPDRPWSAVSGTTLLFLAHTDSMGLELWKVTDAGVLTEVLDLTATEATYLQPAGSLVYLQVKQQGGAIELFRTDGTTAGTVPLLASPLLPNGATIRLGSFAKIVTAGSLVYFAGYDTSGQKLWRSDGTNVGTVILASSLPGAAGAFDATPAVRLPNGTLLSYGASLPVGTGVGLWAFSGNTTTFLANLPATSKPVEFHLAGSVAIIGCGNRLWRSDGTIGGTYDLGLTDGSAGQRAWPGVTLGSSVIFSAYGDGHGVEPWKTDGSIANTLYLKDIAVGTNGSGVRHMVPFRGGVLFEAASTITNNTRNPELWFSNGTDAGTRKLLDNQTGEDLVSCGGRAYFAHYTAATGFEPWTTDGTVAGTLLLKDLLPGQFTAADPNASGPNSSRPRYFTCIDGTMFFQAGGGSGITDLWRSDGTSAGTRKLHSFGVSLGDGSTPSGPHVAAGHRLIVPVINNIVFLGVGLWSSDGTEAGTSMFRVLNGGFSAQVLSAGDLAYILTGYSGYTTYLWRTDGTDAGTFGISNGSAVAFMTDFYGRLAYTRSYGTASGSICTTSGDSGGTCITPTAPTTQFTFGMQPLNGRLYYNTPALRSTNGFDDEPSGLLRVPQLLGAAGGRLFVNGAIDPSPTSLHLLRTDGTAAGTEALMESQATEVKASGGRAYIAGDELYALDLEVTPTSFSPTTVAAAGGETVTISGRGFTGPVTVRVGSIEATVGTVSDTTITFTAPARDFGTYPIDLTLGDGRRMTLDEPLTFTCSATAVVTPLPNPVCPMTPVVLHGSGGARCSWLPAAGLDDPTSCTPTATVSVPTTYRLQVFTANGCPSANYPGVTVDVYTAPVTPVITLANVTDDRVHSGTTYTASVPDAGPGATYTWTLPGGGTIMAGANTRTVSFRPPCTLWMRLAVVVTSANGCVAVAQKDLNPIQPSMVSISPRVANPGTLMTVTGTDLHCLLYLELAGPGDGGAAFNSRNAIVPTIINSTTAQFRFPADSARLQYLFELSTNHHPVSELALTRAVPRDFATDLRTDVFWRNSATGATSIWNINGTTFTGLVSNSAPPPWEPAVFGDFNGDTRTDVFWYNPATGETSIWLMNGITPATTVRSTRVPVGWKPAGGGDFNGDGKSDLFWINSSTGETSIWFMDGTVVASAVRSITVPTDWRPAGFGDFNADTNCDIVWLRPSTGETSIWLMIGTGTPGGTVRSQTLAGWTIAGCADFNGDHYDDIFWHNPTTGASQIWRMSGSFIYGKDAGVTMPAGFVPAALGTFDGNGAADVFWYNPTTGETSVWLRTFFAPAITAPLLRVDNLNWKPVIVP